MGGIWGYLRAHKRLWVPIVVMTALFAGAIIASAGFGLVPFAYTRL